MTNIRFRNRPTSSQKPYDNDDQDEVLYSKEEPNSSCDEIPSNNTKKLQFLDATDSMPLVQDGVNEQTI